MTKKLDSPSSAVRIRVMKRDRFQCTYCGAPGTDAELEVDHIIPVSKGGSHHMSNLTTACRSCNQKKSDGTLAVTHVPRKNNVSGLVGMFLHTFKNGEVNYQGQIIAVDGDIVLVQLFEWFTGGPTKVEPISKERIYSNECVLYASCELMQTGYEKEEIKRKRREAAAIQK